MTTVSFAERSSGDGMECHIANSEDVQSQSEIKEPAAKTHVRRNVVDDSNLIASITALTVESKLKQPKFVPYEPYKAAVTPMVVHAKHTGHANGFQQCKSLKNICGIRHVAPAKKTTVIDEVQLKPCKCVVENLKLEEELIVVRGEKKALEDQLKIQTQVNKELKNLLVASVGEDMQAKVQFLTEDKTKLAQDILTYSEKLMEESEAIEKLSIQCDVWRSKYLASSLIVDELAGWKAVLSHHLNEAMETIKALVQENELNRTKTQNIFSYLKAVNVERKMEEHNIDNTQKFNNAETKFKISPDLENISMPQEKLLNQSENVNECLMSRLLQSPSSKGEQMAAKVLAHTSALMRMNIEGHLPYDSWPISLSGKFGVASRFHPYTRFEGFTYHCCHCKGEIKIL